MKCIVKNTQWLKTHWEVSLQPSLPLVRWGPVRRGHMCVHKGRLYPSVCLTFHLSSVSCSRSGSVALLYQVSTRLGELFISFGMGGSASLSLPWKWHQGLHLAPLKWACNPTYPSPAQLCPYTTKLHSCPVSPAQPLQSKLRQQSNSMYQL